jgi:Protein of unknown function (DUF3048) N-terminal domain/Protein of unknown function (DUF3048) C-terminal domain
VAAVQRTAGAVGDPAGQGRVNTNERRGAVKVSGPKALGLAAGVVAALVVITVAWGWSHAAPKAVPKAVVRPTAVMHPSTRSRALPPPHIVATNPLTGVGAVPKGPVIAVKLDDTAPGRPSLGLDKADVIYIEEAEGGLSRMLAVYASAKPRVEAVRSVRTSDPELVGAYARIILVASGGGGNALPTLDHSGLWSSINDRGQVGFNRDPSRFAPYNVVADLTKISAAFKEAEGVRDVGFAWAIHDPRLATAKSALSVNTLVGSTNVSFVWNAQLGQYVRSIGGQLLRAASGAPVAKPNVLVQYCQVNPDRSDIDVNGNPSMFTTTVGSGRVVLFRNGKRLEGTWSRRSIGDRTRYKDGAGKPLLLAPGGTFVVLVRPGAPA